MGVGDIPLSELLGYELCSLPAALFDNYMRMRTGDKAKLIHHLVKLVPESVVSTLPTTGLRNIIDGEGLLHKFAWPKNSTYAEICTLYVRHVSSSYANATVIFDGYHGPSAKDEAHRRRSSNDVRATVSVTKEMHLTMSKKAFLGGNSSSLTKWVELESMLSTPQEMRLQAAVIRPQGHMESGKTPPDFTVTSVFLQVQAWKGNDIPPEEWGWARSSTGLVPVPMSEPAAPAKHQM
ncbi:Hypothetical predicted protein [Paramuricea clavata]|uniref:Uncharacterized protein n=1 Tax=Paramuricea clavata TaxID=317549 RepID=A0A7D9HDY4_PARCT|nr:Hypothetical predicted protein [Paramuricea clavata]